MNSKVGVAITLTVAGAGSLALAAWVYFRQRWRRKSPEEIERLRRSDLNQRGRITAGTVNEWLEPPTAPSAIQLVVYRYEVAGVTYEVAQDCTLLPEVLRAASWLVGQTVSVKYDPLNPSNSIIACEEWSGLPKQPGTPAPGSACRPLLEEPAGQS